MRKAVKQHTISMLDKRSMPCPTCKQGGKKHRKASRKIRHTGGEVTILSYVFKCTHCRKFFSDPRIEEFALPAARYSTALIKKALRYILMEKRTYGDTSLLLLRDTGHCICASTVHDWVVVYDDLLEDEMNAKS